jgi:thioredoxin reductase (NADPH)
LRHEFVTSVLLSEDIKQATIESDTYRAPAVIVANGSIPRHLGTPGEDVLAGRGMGMNAVRDGKAYAGKNMYVIGGSDGAIKEAIYLCEKRHARDASRARCWLRGSALLSKLQDQYKKLL